LLSRAAVEAAWQAEGVAISEQDLVHLRTCVALAREALEAGDGPFGTVLVGPDGEVLWTGRNHDGAGDETQHPELAVSQWSASLSPEVRAACTVYTSGEHCPMCSAAHGWMGLGRIVYALSSAQLLAWRREWGSAEPVVHVLPINDIAPRVPVDGPAPELEDELRELHHAAAVRR
jgi:tRNA(Arg) A34 adenosine deaminase TadA